MNSEALRRLRERAAKSVEEELVYARRLRGLAKRIRHPVLAALFEAIAKDSEKHSLIMDAIRRYIDQERPLITREDLEEIRREIRRHIEEEAEAIRELSEALQQVDDPALRLLIEAMLRDERIHHELLVNIEKLIAEKEAVDPEEFWDYLWKHSPYHGAPGG